MLSDIPTEFEEVEPTDDGVETCLRAEEEYVHYGEQIERETTLQFLEDGGVAITQRIPEQNIYDSLTLNGAVAKRLAREVDPDA